MQDSKRAGHQEVMIRLSKRQEEDTEGWARLWRYMGIKTKPSGLWYGIPEYSWKEQLTQPVTQVQTIKPWWCFICRWDFYGVVAWLCGGATVDKPQRWLRTGSRKQATHCAAYRDVFFPRYWEKGPQNAADWVWSVSESRNQESRRGAQRAAQQSWWLPVKEEKCWWKDHAAPGAGVTSHSRTLASIPHCVACPTSEGSSLGVPAKVVDFQTFIHPAYLKVLWHRVGCGRMGREGMGLCSLLQPLLAQSCTIS